MSVYPPIPAGGYVPTADQRVVMCGVPWSHFEAQLALRGDAAGPRTAYLDGTLEITSPSKDHERITSYIGCLVEAYALERGIDLSPYGGWTLKSAPKKSGAEPDECYIVGSDQSPAVPHLAIVPCRGAAHLLDLPGQQIPSESRARSAVASNPAVIGDAAPMKSTTSLPSS